MKKFYILLVFCIVSCTHSSSLGPTRPANAFEQAEVDLQEVDPPSFKVREFVFRLSEKEGRCVLRYRSARELSEEIDTNMEAPCDFIGRKTKPDPPQRFEFKQGADQVTVLLVTGGPPHPVFSDEFMQKGCGTRLARIRVYEDRVEIQPAPEPNQSPTREPTSYCPSNPLDEVFFATG